jgi:hypothetical protein
MIIKFSRENGKEFKMFEENIMWAREYNSVLWICRDRQNKKNTISSIFNWVDKKHIININIWRNSKNSIESIEIKNYCHKHIKIKFRLSKIKHQKVHFVDDLVDKYKKEENPERELLWQEYMDTINKRIKIKENKNGR